MAGKRVSEWTVPLGKSSLVNTQGSPLLALASLGSQFGMRPTLIVTMNSEEAGYRTVCHH